MDFDGTLVDKSLEVSSEAEYFVKNIISSGNHFSIATGRAFFGVVEVAAKKLNLTDNQIVAAGSTIVDVKTGKPIWVKYLQKETAKNLINKLKDLNADFAVETPFSVYTPEARQWHQYGPGITFQDLGNFDFNNTNKIVIFPEAEREDKIHELEAVLNNFEDDIHVIRAGSKLGTSFDITSAHASKHFAVLELIKILNIDKNQTIGIGDGYNDYPLLSACGFKVAIDTAPKELKEIADLVISREMLFS